MGYQTILNPVPRLLLITDLGRMPEQVLLDKIEASLMGGVDAVLLRERQLDVAHMLALAARLRELTLDAKARLFIHTQADVALAVAADGVHVSRHDIGMIPDMRCWLAAQGAKMSMSVSCHDALELTQAADVAADFALLSPVFATTSHPGAQTLGVDAFRQLAIQARLPVVALGGIDADNRHTLPEYGVAVMSALLEAPAPAAVARVLSMRL